MMGPENRKYSSYGLTMEQSTQRVSGRDFRRDARIRRKQRKLLRGSGVHFLFRHFAWGEYRFEPLLLIRQVVQAAILGQRFLLFRNIAQNFLDPR